MSVSHVKTGRCWDVFDEETGKKLGWICPKNGKYEATVLRPYSQTEADSFYDALSLFE